MCTTEQAGSGFVKCLIHQGNRICLTWWYMQHMHRILVILYMCHLPVYIITGDEDPPLNPVPYGVWCVYHKTEIKETVL